MEIKTTSYFAPVPWNYIHVGTSTGTPKRSPFEVRMYEALAPKHYMLRLSVEEYRDAYMRQLSKLDPEKVLKELEGLTEGFSAAIACFEPPADPEAWCHRGYISAWLHDTLGLEVPELGFEDMGFGWEHPKIPAKLRGKKWSG